MSRIVLGLTGSMGMGKSTVSAMFRARGVPGFCMDKAVHQARGPGGAALPELEALIPGSTGLAGIDLAKLRAFAFADADNLVALESLMMPHIMRALEEFDKETATDPIVLLDIPLLFEKGFDTLCSYVAVVSAPHEVQLERIMARSTMTIEQVEAILSKQMPDEEKRGLADFIIDTGKSLEETDLQVEEILNQLR